MADMNFGVNLLPVSNKSNSLGSSSKKWDNVYVDKINGKSPTALNDSLSATQSGIAIIVDGDTVTTTISEGQYVYIKGSTVLAEGLYTAITAVSFGTVITAQTAATYFTAVSGGGLNAIQQSLAKISIGWYIPTEPVPANEYKDYQIAFGKAYSQPPIVVANCVNYLTPITEITGPNILSIRHETFIVRYKSSYSEALTPETTWIAIGI